MQRFRDYDDYWYFRQYDRPDLDLMSRMQYLDIKTYLPDDILTKVDRASMAVSLEVRPPMLDHTLVEYVASLPAHVRNPHGELKHLLRRAVADLIPREIIERPKKGFSVPNTWVRSWGRPSKYRFGDHQDSLFSVLTAWMHKGDTGPLLDIIA
jgi:asparagine synthase (glutamine-hydrolysing)